MSKGQELPNSHSLWIIDFMNLMDQRRWQVPFQWAADQSEFKVWHLDSLSWKLVKQWTTRLLHWFGLVILNHIIQWQHGPGLVEESSSQSQNGQALLVSSLCSNLLPQHRTQVQNILMFQWRTQHNIGGRWQGIAIANASLSWHNKTCTLLGLSDTTKLKLPAHLTKSLGFSLNA